MLTQHSHMKLIGVWDPWPSRRSRWPVCDDEVPGRKIRLNHSTPIKLDVHPFSEVVYNQSGVPIAGN